MSYLLLILLFIPTAFAELEKITIQNLDLTYANPYGSGEFEKLSLGVSLAPQTFPVEIFRREKSFEIMSPFVSFEYLNPIPFVYDIKTLDAMKLNLHIDSGTHFARGEKIKLDNMLFEKFDVVCQGTSTQKEVTARLKEDCLNKLTASSTHMELPFEVMKQIASDLPDEETEATTDMPANDFFFSMNQGNFNSYVRIKYVVRAYLKVWGHVQFEDNGSTTAIRVDSIKFGILPVTDLVMNRLRSSVQSPNVVIDPPWIRIKSGSK